MQLTFLNVWMFPIDKVIELCFGGFGLYLLSPVVVSCQICYLARARISKVQYLKLYIISATPRARLQPVHRRPNTFFFIFDIYFTYFVQCATVTM